MEFEGLRLDVAEGLARLTFNDPARGNPIDGPLCASLCEAAIQLSENRNVRCVLVAAEGKVFSYGGDVGAFVADLADLSLNIKRWTTTLHSAISRFQRMDAPIVAPASSTSGVSPRCTRCAAAARPTGPAPITTTGKVD